MNQPFLIWTLALIPLATMLSLNADKAAAADVGSASEERLSLDRAWRFNLGEIPFPVIKGHSASYSNAKAGKAWGAAAPDFDDSQWRQVDLPHDWAVEGPFDQNENLSQGYRPRGSGWYRRYLRLDPSDRGRALELQFDGVATHCTVWVNGTVMHRNWCGYTSFSIDLTPIATYGDQLNCIAIQVDANAMEGWWYEGAGIYRHTWLVKRGPVHIITDGVWANPVLKQDGSWELPVQATLDNIERSDAKVEVAAELLDPESKVVGAVRGAADAKSLDDTVVRLSLAVSGPRRWSIQSPVLYTVRTTLWRDGKQIDQRLTHCGFRTLRFDPEKGLFLNDQHITLHGTCNHQDHAGVGVAVPDSLWDFRIRKLKEMGSNAYRCAHNPPAKEFLDACDRLGMLVMDENRNFNTSPEYLRQLEWMVRRDRNHPCVMLWSVFNEEPMQGTEAGFEMVRRMAAAVKRLDATRPVTAAMSNGMGTPINVSQAVDVVGFNYQQNSYDGFHKAHPDQPLMSSEDTSAFMTRGVYETDKKLHTSDSYDSHAAPWGATHRAGWKAIESRPYLAGGFVWTGFDYRGEPTPWSWPSVSSVFGCMDVCGFPKAAFYMHQAAWVTDRPILQLIPHWNWKGREGQPIKVMAISNAETVELFLNGKSLGEKTIDRLEGGEWDVPYAPGKLEAVGKKAGRETGRSVVETTGEPVALKLTLDRPELAGDGADAQPVTVSAIDAQGREVPTANVPVTFELSGSGAIIGHGNGDPTCHDPEKGNHRSLFNGLAQVIVQSTRDTSGETTLIARSPGLQRAEARIGIRAVAPIPAVPPTEPVFALVKWRMAPFSHKRPDPNQKVADSDMNTWASVQPGGVQKFEGGPWTDYRITFAPVSGIQQNGGRIHFSQITGTAEVWLDGKLLGEKKDPAPAALVVKLPPEKGNRSLSVLVNSGGAVKAGLSGSVVVEP